MYCQLTMVAPEGDGAEGESCSLEKAWHGLHYLLTGSSFEGEGPLAFLLQGGEPADGGDPEDGGPRFFSAEEVNQLHEAISRVSDQELWSRFDPEEMNSQGVYPTIWDEPEEELKAEYLMYFGELKKFLAQASRDRQAMLVDIG
jgi:hypothetical protein